ncbi:MAG: hypothetical protein ACKOE2_09480 [Actinomycetales bacterium]
MQDEVRGYVSAASGMTEAAADRAKDLAARLLAQGLQLSAKAPEVLEQIQQAADGLLSGQRLDPAALATAIREQVDLAIGRSSLVREEELAALRAQVVRLEGRLDNAVREMAEKLAAQASNSPAPTGTSWPSEPASPSTPAAGTAAGSGLANGWTPDV